MRVRGVGNAALTKQHLCGRMDMQIYKHPDARVLRKTLRGFRRDEHTGSEGVRVTSRRASSGKSLMRISRVRGVGNVGLSERIQAIRFTKILSKPP